MKIGAKIRQLRREKGLTQEELALDLDTATSTISRIENDERAPSLDMLVRLAASLQAGVGELFTEPALSESTPHLAESQEFMDQYGKDTLADDYMEIRRCFRNLTPANRRLALELLKTLARTQKQE